MDESQPTLYTSYFGAMAQNTVDGFNEIFDFADWNITSLGTAEVYSRFTTEASRGQVNPDVVFTYDPIAMRQLYTAGLLQNYVSPNVSETDAWPDRTQTDVEGMIQQHHTFNSHVWNPQVYDEAGLEQPGRHHTIDWLTDHIEDNPDFYNENTCKYDGITSTSAWQQMDFYAVENGEDWMRDQYETLATTDPRSFWSTSTMGGWVGNGEVAYGLGLAQWIVARFIAPDFELGETVTWNAHTNDNIMHPNHQVTKNADNPNSGKLFADWAQSPHGNAWIARNWFMAPGREDLDDENLATDPVWEEVVRTSSIRDGPVTAIGDSIWMDFEERTVRSSQKSKYKDMWYNIFN
jgi:ABC-type Fe3+ transport system substrate-binding protein